MKRFYAICGALLVGIPLVGPVHAGPPHARQRPGHPSRHQPGRHWRVRSRPVLLPWQWLPERAPAWWGDDPDTGTDGPNAGGPDLTGGTDGPTDDPNAGGPDLTGGTDDPNAGAPQPGEDIGGAKVARPAVTPKGSSQRRLPKFGKGSPGSRARGRAVSPLRPGMAAPPSRAP
jgi:hypothetical protein